MAEQPETVSSSVNQSSSTQNSPEKQAQAIMGISQFPILVFMSYFSIMGGP
ncbi:hypothetical protein OIU78_024311 [Salix suchowensis]|nr:hypothetical protein OIU78_024311 [Salix suchowensis]